MTIGERVKEARKALNKTQDEFSAPLGINKAAISKIEKGENNLSASLGKLIEKTYNISENWLRSGEGEMFVTGSPEEEVAAFAGETLRLPLDAPQMRFMRAMSKIPPEWWPKIGEIIDEVLEEERRAKEDK